MTAQRAPSGQVTVSAIASSGRAHQVRCRSPRIVQARGAPQPAAGPGALTWRGGSAILGRIERARYPSDAGPNSGDGSALTKRFAVITGQAHQEADHAET